MASDKTGMDFVVEILEKAKIAHLTTMDLEGHLVSRPLELQEADSEGNLWFFTQDPSHKADEIRANPNVNVAIQDSKGFLSISGAASLTKDQGRIDELWKASAAAWFEKGREDPTVALLKVDSHTAEYWANDEPKVASVFKLAKSAVTGGQPDVGRNDVVEM